MTGTRRPDGRHERSTRTRAAIVAAHRALIQQGAPAPTTPRIAAAARWRWSPTSTRPLSVRLRNERGLADNVARRLVLQVLGVPG